MATFVNEMAQGARVDSALLVRSKELRVARSGDPYLSFELADRTGSIPAVMFRPDSGASEVPVGAVVRVSGSVRMYRGVKRLAVETLAPASTWDPGSFVAKGPRDDAELTGELRRLTQMVGHPGLSRVLRRILGEPGFFDRFRVSPASQHRHHAYVGGLLEHTVNVADLCSHVAARYEGVDRDLLVTAALLHDVGKVDELTVGTGISYTDEGRLLGHVVMGARRVADAARAVRLDQQRAIRLEHALLSHHGELEWGSPKRPATIESLLLHHADNLDAKTAGLSDLLAGAIRVDEAWTDAANLYRRPLFAPMAAEDQRPRHAIEEDIEERLSA